MRKLQRGLIFFAVSISLVLSGQNCFAKSGQIAKEDWVDYYQGLNLKDSVDIPAGIAIDSQGYIYVTGENGEAGDPNYVTIKYDPRDGRRIWESYFEKILGKNDVPTAIAIDDEDNVYVTGFSADYNGNNIFHDFLTIKYDPNDGHEAWVRRYNSPANFDDEAEAIAIDSQDNIYVTGRSSTSFWPHFDYLTLKYDSNGNKLWDAYYDGPFHGVEEPMDIAVDSQNDVYITGYSESADGGYDYLTLKYDSETGEKVREWRYDWNNNDYARRIVIDHQDNIYVTGDLTIKYNPDSDNAVWVVPFGSWPWTGTSNDIGVDSLDNVYVTGSENSGGYLTIKYDPNGRKLWGSFYNPGDYPSGGADALAIDDQDNLYVTGGVGDWGPNDYDFATIKYNSSNGKEVWIARLNGAGNDNDDATALAVDNQGNVYVTGRTNDPITRIDMLTVKYSQLQLGVTPHKIFDVNLEEGIR